MVHDSAVAPIGVVCLMMSGSSQRRAGARGHARAAAGARALAMRPSGWATGRGGDGAQGALADPRDAALVPTASMTAISCARAHRPVLRPLIQAPSTLGTFLRSFTFEHVRQLDRLLCQALHRAWAACASPGNARLVIDVDSFVGQVHGQPSRRRLRLHGQARLPPDRCDALRHQRGPACPAAQGAANTQRGALRFTNEQLASVTRPSPPASSCSAPTRESGTRRCSRAGEQAVTTRSGANDQDHRAIVGDRRSRLV